MTPGNLGLVFGPTIMRGEEEDLQNLNEKTAVMIYLIENALHLFPNQ
jgi:hypothetical protein